MDQAYKQKLTAPVHSTLLDDFEDDWIWTTDFQKNNLLFKYNISIGTELLKLVIMSTAFKNVLQKQSSGSIPNCNSNSPWQGCWILLDQPSVDYNIPIFKNLHTNYRRHFLSVQL